MGCLYRHRLVNLLPLEVVGDFKAILHGHERKERSDTPSMRVASHFTQCFRDCDLIDGGFQGYSFTWKWSNLEQKLDHLVMNIQWRMRLQEAVVAHLPPFKSDHHPLLIKLESESRTNRRRRPFRFIASWIIHSDFNRFMR